MVLGSMDRSPHNIVQPYFMPPCPLAPVLMRQRRLLPTLRMKYTQFCFRMIPMIAQWRAASFSFSASGLTSGIKSVCQPDLERLQQKQKQAYRWSGTCGSRDQFKISYKWNSPATTLTYEESKHNSQRPFDHKRTTQGCQGSQVCV